MNDLITSGTEIKQRIISEINNASQCVYVAMAYFTDREIAMAIIGAKNRNVNVDIILSSNAQNEIVKLMLKGAGVSVHAFETGDSRGIMHHKFCLIDNRISINGSYNYSLNASNNNIENVQVSDDIAFYSQFLTEFERLKYNIDNNIGVNDNSSNSNAEPVREANIIDSFSQQLQSLVYSTTDLNTQKYKEDGYNLSKDSQGNIDIFRTEYGNIKKSIRTYATDEGLGSKKNTLTANVSIAYDNCIANLDKEKDDKISLELRSSVLEKKQIVDRISDLKNDLLRLETGNDLIGEKGLVQLNKEIEKNKIERKALEQSFIVKKFWSIGTILVLLLLVVFTFYLSLFFASALYKVFFERNIIQQSLEQGLTPDIPQIVDANAIIKIFNKEGSLFAMVAVVFFLFPVLLSNIKLFGSKNKTINNLLFWVGLLIFDIVVAAVVALNTNEIKSLLKGGEFEMKIWEVLVHGEFWLMFIFGMIPLIITHYAIGFIYEAYKLSQRNIVDAEKNKKIQLLENDIIDFQAEKEAILKKKEEINNAISELNTKINHLEVVLNNSQIQIENSCLDSQKKIKAIFDDYYARISSGKIFTDVIFESVISAFKSGFVEFLPEYYSSDEVAFRVKEIEEKNTIVNY